MKISPSHLALRRSRFAVGALIAGVLSVPAGAQNVIEAWGVDSYSQVSAPPTGNDFVRLSTNRTHSVAMRTDGSLVSWGNDNMGQVSNTPSGTGFVQIATGGNHSVALHADGSLTSWGSNVFGQVLGTPSGTNFMSIAAGDKHSIAVRTDGTLVSWGADAFGVVTLTPGGSGFSKVAGGIDMSVALRADGSIVAWGRDEFGQASNAPTGSVYTQIAAGPAHCLALRANGAIVAWGSDFAGEVSNIPPGTGYLHIAAGELYSIAIRPDHKLAYWGVTETEPPATFASAKFEEVAAGFVFTLALRAENSGESYCFGDGPGTACPCAASGYAGEGCANSGASGGATLVGSGDADLALDSFQLHVGGVPGDKPGLVLRGSNQLNAELGNPVGDGLLCTGGQTARSQVQVTVGGNTTLTDFQGLPFGQSSYGAGVQTNYQFWYRDNANTCSGSGFNFSNAWTVT